MNIKVMMDFDNSLGVRKELRPTSTNESDFGKVEERRKVVQEIKAELKLLKIRFYL